MGGHLLGWRTVCAVELDAYARSVLLARQRDGLLPRFPVWDDVRTFDGRPWRGTVRVVSGGFPCTDISSAGGRAGIEGEHSACGEKWRASLAKWDRSSLSWRTHQTLLFADSTECLETFPTWGLMRDGELWELETPAFPTAASEHGSWPTPKARDWRSGGTDPSKVQARIEKRRNIGVIDLPDAAVHRLMAAGIQWTAESVLLRNAHGMADRVGRLRAIGNGQVPRVAATAWRMLAPPQHA